MNNTEIEFFAPILDAALSTHGGFSFNPVTKTFILPGTESTYAVSVPGFEKCLKADVGQFCDNAGAGIDIKDYLTRLPELGLLSVPANSYQLVVGGWRDTNTGDVYLDLSIITCSRYTASVLAVQNGQLSFYDFEKKEVIWVRDAKTREVLPAYRPFVFLADGRLRLFLQRTGEKPYGRDQAASDLATGLGCRLRSRGA